MRRLLFAALLSFMAQAQAQQTYEAQLANSVIHHLRSQEMSAELTVLGRILGRPAPEVFELTETGEHFRWTIEVLLIEMKSVLEGKKSIGYKQRAIQNLLQVYGEPKNKKCIILLGYDPEPL